MSFNEHCPRRGGCASFPPFSPEVSFKLSTSSLTYNLFRNVLLMNFVMKRHKTLNVVGSVKESVSYSFNRIQPLDGAVSSFLVSPVCTLETFHNVLQCLYSVFLRKDKAHFWHVRIYLVAGKKWNGSPCSDSSQDGWRISHTWIFFQDSCWLQPRQSCVCSCV